MKKLVTLIVTVTMMLTMMTMVTEAAKKVVAVMPLESITGGNDGQKIADMMTEELISALYKSGKYTVIERSQMATVFKEQGLSLTGAVDPNKAVQVGKMFGAQYVVVGKVTMASIEAAVSNRVTKFLGINGLNTLEGKVALSYRFIDVETGEIKFMGTAEGAKTGETAISAIQKSCKEASENVLSDMVKNIKARVADISGDEIYIDMGKEGGFRKGETLEIVRETSPIKINGEIVGMKEIKVGTAKVTEVNDKFSICEVIDSDMTVHKGDVVKRRQKK